MDNDKFNRRVLVAIILAMVIAAIGPRSCGKNDSPKETTTTETPTNSMPEGFELDDDGYIKEEQTDIISDASSEGVIPYTIIDNDKSREVPTDYSDIVSTDYYAKFFEIMPKLRQVKEYGPISRYLYQHGVELESQGADAINRHFEEVCQLVNNYIANHEVGNYNACYDDGKGLLDLYNNGFNKATFFDLLINYELPEGFKVNYGANCFDGYGNAYLGGNKIIHSMGGRNALFYRLDDPMDDIQDFLNNLDNSLTSTYLVTVAGNECYVWNYTELNNLCDYAVKYVVQNSAYPNSRIVCIDGVYYYADEDDNVLGIVDSYLTTVLNDRSTVLDFIATRSGDVDSIESAVTHLVDINPNFSNQRDVKK